MTAPEVGGYDTERLARTIRGDALEMVHSAKAAHIGSCLSVADILAVLYGTVLRHRPLQPRWYARDRVILSKGHAAAIGYAVLARSGYFDAALLRTYCADDSLLAGHLTATVPGVEFSTGSLGHGLPVGCGMALGLRPHESTRVFVIISDGECDEGSTWEAALFAAHHQLHNLMVIIDANMIQSFGRTEEVLNIEPLAEKWDSFGWTVREINGHSHSKLGDSLSAPAEEGRPTVVIARTVKGRGVSFMEDQLVWHYRPPSDEQLIAALAEVHGR